MSVFFFYLGIVILIIGWILFLIEAFKKSIFWGLGSFLLTPVYITFLIKNWRATKFTFYLQIIGLVIILIYIFKTGNDRVFNPLVTVAMIIDHYT